MGSAMQTDVTECWRCLSRPVKPRQLLQLRNGSGHQEMACKAGRGGGLTAACLLATAHGRGGGQHAMRAWQAQDSVCDGGAPSSLHPAAELG